jgi:hypothetical protein
MLEFKCCREKDMKSWGSKKIADSQVDEETSGPKK